MADYPDFSRPAEEALLRLANFRTQNPLRVTTGPAARLPSPPRGLPSPSMSPTTSVPQQMPPAPSIPRFHFSRIDIPPTAYAPAYASTHQIPQANHMPGLAAQPPSPHPPESQAYEPLVYSEPLGCITYNMVYDRVYLVLQNNLTEWWTRNPDALQKVSQRLTCMITYSGPRGMFGPDGIQSLYQIDMYIGREGIYRYLCLAVHSKPSGFSIILKGDLCEKDGRDPMYDAELLAMCRNGFDKGVAKLHASIVAENEKKAGQKK